MSLLTRLAFNFICKKNSKKLSFTSFVSIIGISFGVAAFLVVITIFNSFQSEIKNIISSVNPNLIIYSPSGIQNPIQLEEKLKKELIHEPIEKMSRFVYQESVMGLDRQSSAVYIRAIEGESSSSADALNNFITPKGALKTINEGSKQIDSQRNTLEENTNPTGLPHVILGKELAESLSLKIGDVVTLLTFGMSEKASGIRYNKLYVTGLISSGLSEYDRKTVLMNFDDGIKLFGIESWASGIEIKLQNKHNALSVSLDLNQKIQHHVVAWQQIDKGLFEQIERDGTTIKFIVLIISFVAGFNIIVTLSLTVMDRAKQISLLRALGARKSLVLMTFVFSGFILGVLGSSLGVVLGFIILEIFSGISLGDYQKFYYLEKIPVNLDFQFILFSFLTAIILSFIGALYPAWKATRVTPMHGLKQNN